MTSSALQSWKGQLIIMSQWCRSALCSHPLLALTDHWTHGAANRHTVAPISHTRPSPRSDSYYSFPVPLRVEVWVGPSTQQVSNLLSRLLAFHYLNQIVRSMRVADKRFFNFVLLGLLKSKRPYTLTACKVRLSNLFSFEALVRLFPPGPRVWKLIAKSPQLGANHMILRQAN